jgi:D-apionolactonase
MDLFQEYSMSYGKETKWHCDHNENCKQLIIKAGRLSMIYEAGNLRHIASGNIELVRMIYSALRDKDWLTIKPVISDEEIEVRPDSFNISYKAICKSGEIDFLAHYTIVGNPDNSLIFSIEGEALNTFEKNRIGFCVLHPVEDYAGGSCEIVKTNCKSESLIFPWYISPHQPFRDIKSMRWKISGTSCAIDFYGDVFETEDQRNWTDDSYKTYCTPLSRPFPVKIQKGEKISQKVLFKLEGGGQSEITYGGQISISIGREKSISMPMIGIGKSTRQQPMTPGEIQILESLRFDHYRVDLYLFMTDWKSVAEKSVSESKMLGYPLELALFFDENASDQAAEFIDWISNSKPEIATINIYHKTLRSTPDELINSVIPSLKNALPGVRFGCGTNSDFVNLNRNRPESLLYDNICYSIHPQEHASDNLTLIENLQAQRCTVESARQFSNGRKIWISPVNIQRRFNANKANYETFTPGTTVPPQVDSRLMSLFGACWTAGSMKYLFESGIEGVTFYETVGERGIFQGDYPSRWPDEFPSFKGMIFPLFSVFKFILKYKSSGVIESRSSHPLKVQSLVFSDGNHLKMILVNYTPVRHEVILEGWQGDISYRQLNDETFENAVCDINWLDITEKIAKEPSEPLFLKPFSVSFIE